MFRTFVCGGCGASVGSEATSCFECLSTFTTVNDDANDLKKQCIVLMGLPAAGKSTFVKKFMGTLFPGIGSFKVINSDVQLAAVQYETAKTHWRFLQESVKSEKDLEQFIRDTAYNSNLGQVVHMKITWKWLEENRSSAVAVFYRQFKRDFYASYFDIRDVAKSRSDTLFETKIKESGNIMVIDTVAAKPDSLKPKIDKAKEEGYVVSILYLKSDPQRSIAGDAFRGKHEGRQVGEGVIMSYASKMEAAWKTYGEWMESGYVHRLIQYEWNSTGPRPIDGNWKQLLDKKNRPKKE